MATTPLFYVQIVDDNGEPVKITSLGNRQAALVQTITESIVSRGVGVFRSEAHVAADIQAGLLDVLNGPLHLLPAVPRYVVCPVCSVHAYAWRTYADGSMTCIACTK